MLMLWAHDAVYERARVEGELFLPELRPVVAMFMRFHGIDFDADEQAGDKLDSFIRQVQQILARYDGALLELTIGDKGSYLYAAFGAPHVHEDDARRAVFAAREMFPLCEKLGFIEPLQIGISQGVMRVGGYGSATRRMYGAQGDEVNLAARLMTEAQPGTVLVSGRIQKSVSEEFDLEPLEPIRLKGKTDPLLPYVVQGLRNTRIQHLQEAYYSLPMVGREQELDIVNERMGWAKRGQGQVVGVTAPAGMGKSRLTAEVIRASRRKRQPTFGGECQSFGTNIPYLVWAPILHSFFGLDTNLPPRRRVRALESEVAQLAPQRLELLPLLGPVLNVPIPDNELTSGLEPEFKRSALHALILDCVRAAAQEARDENQTILFVVEDTHWIDPASSELLQELGTNIEGLPVLLLLNYRPPELESEHLPRLRALSNFAEIRIGELTREQGEGLIRAKLAQHAPDSAGSVSTGLVAKVNEQAQGNPFFIEQLLEYLHDRGINFRDPIDSTQIELPNTLHRLVLSRMDQLNEQQQLTLKAASIIGRWFTLAHLCGYFPRVGPRQQVEMELARMQNYDLTLLDQAEPEMAYLFKHVVTHQVAYESLSFGTRASLHEAYAQFLETHDDPARALDLLAYHFDRSENLPKRREYLKRAGTAAAARFANTEAVDYLTRALAVTSDTEARYELLAARERVLDVRGERELQRSDLAELESAAKDLNDPGKLLNVLVAQGWFAERITEHTAAERVTAEVERLLTAESLPEKERTRFGMEARLLRGVILWQQGDPAAAMPHFERALELAESAGEPVGQARALSFLGNVYRETGDYARARACYLEQLPLARECHDVRREWAALNNLGLVATAGGDFEAALEHYQAALRIVRDIGDRLGEGLVLSNMAIAAQDRGDYELAGIYNREALGVAVAIGDKRNVCRIRLNLGELKRLSGEYEAAGDELEQARKMAEALGDRMSVNFALMNLAALAADRGDWLEARQLANAALPGARSIGHRDGESFLLNTLAQAQAAEGNAEASQATFLEALEIWESLEPMVYALDAYAGLAEIALARDDVPLAMSRVAPILDFLDAHPTQRGAPSALNGAYSAYRILHRAGDPRAKAVLLAARAALEERANKLNETQRDAFLTNIRINRLVMGIE
jgi:tetratricopeptide (TPR) repeat protein/class 3 adenylate cyclase